MESEDVCMQCGKLLTHFEHKKHKTFCSSICKNKWWYPNFEDNVRGNGLFIKDAVHYTADVNAWVADCIIDSIKK